MSSSLPRRTIGSRLLRVRSAMVLGGIAFVSLAGMKVVGELGALAKPPAFFFSTVDTTFYYGPNQFNAIPTPTVYLDQFTITNLPGSRVKLLVTNGAANGTNRVTDLSLRVNGNQIIGPTSSGATTSGWSAILAGTATDTLRVEVKGPTGSYIKVQVFGTPDLDFNVYGPRQVNGVAGTEPNTVTETFVVPANANLNAADRAYFINGAPNGTNRVTWGSVTLNGATVFSSSEITPAVYSGTKSVTLKVNDTITIKAKGPTTSFITVRMVVRDSAKPIVALTAPVDSLITRDTVVTVTGTTTDQTATKTVLKTTGSFGADSVVVAGSAISATLKIGTGNTTVSATATDAGGRQTTVTRTVIRDATPPVLVVNTLAQFVRAAALTVSGTSQDLHAQTVSANGVNLTLSGVPGASPRSFTGAITLIYGSNLVTTTATDVAGNSSSNVQTVVYDTIPPVITLTTPAEGSNTSLDSVAVTGDAADISLPAVITISSGLVSSTSCNATTCTFSGKAAVTLGANTISVTATDPAGNSSTAVRHVTRNGGLPPDPVLVASVLNRTEVSTIGAATEFLYTGANPIQTGVVPGTVNPVRAAVVKGRVLNRLLQPLSGVTVSVLGHPELGQTLSRADGGYDLALNGGGAVTVDYFRSGYFPAQRRHHVLWQEYVRLDDVILLQPDSVVTTVDLTAASPVIARASVAQDADGPRRATLMFEPGTTATRVNADSSTTPLATIHVRATEYTVGDSGRLSMPAPLPPASRYTYAVEVSVDEAGPGTAVVFNKPVPLYVENFLHVPVGTAVPTGRYERDRGVWVPERNGVVLKVLGTDGNGRAQLDVTGDDVADGPSALNLLGISDYELVQLAGTYPAGSDLWRALVRRTAAQDLNYPWVEVGAPPTDGRVQAGCSARGSDPIRCQLQAQTAFQSVGLVGSAFTLNYASDRTQGNAADRKLDITLTAATLPPFLKRVELEVDVAGQRFRGSFTPAANLTYTFNWDGKDIYNRTVQGVQPVTVLLGYVFPVFYSRPAPGDTSFALPCLLQVGGCQLPGAPIAIPRAEQTEVQLFQTSLGTVDASALGMGGFTLSAQHVYDPVGQTLFQGDGTRRAAAALPPGIRTVAGNGANPFVVDDDIPATSEDLGTPRFLAVTQDGTLYIADFRSPMHLRSVTADGLIHTVIGSVGGSGPNGDGGPASQARINSLQDLAAGPDGSVYLLEQPARVRRIDPAGIITTVAGTGVDGFSGDGGPAVSAQIKGSHGIAVGPDGSLYIADGGNRRIRRVGTDGIINTIAGTGAACGSPFFHPTDDVYNTACGNGVPASQVGLSEPDRVAVGPDGSVYVMDNSAVRIRRIGPDGVIRTVVGNPGQIPNGDGGPVGLASIYGLKSIAVGADGSLYISQAPVDARPVGCRIRRVDPTGIINTFVGGLNCGFAGEGGPATAARIDEVSGMTVGPDGNLYFGDQGRIRRVSGFLPQFGAGQTVIATQDGGAVMVFSPAGRHLLTLDAVTQDTIYRYGYDANRLLVTITDRDDRVTTIVRNGTGVPTAIVMPNGQQTAVQLDANGQLTSLTGPDGLPVRFGIAANGLLAGAVNQAGDSVARYSYDATGKMIGAKNSLGGTTTFAEAVSGLNSTLTVQPPTGRSLVITRTKQPTGAELLNGLLAGSLQVSTSLEPDGNSIKTSADGTVTTTTSSADPRFGTQATLGQETVQLPSGLARVTRTLRGVALSDPADPFTVTVEVDSTITNGRASTLQQNKTANTVIGTSAGGRTITNHLDAQGRDTAVTMSGFPTLSKSYDALGRLLQTKVGGRTQEFAYDARDRVTSVKDALGLVHGFVYDSTGRVTQRYFSDGRVLSLAYDANGNLISVTPPSRPGHTLLYNPEGQATLYTGPDAGTGAPAIRFVYDTAGRLSQIIRPDSSVVAMSYATTSLSQTIALPGGEALQLVRDPVSGNLTSTTLTGGATLTHTYDGVLRTGTTWSGPMAGSVTQAFDADFRVLTQSINGGNTITRGYDADGLLTAVGALTLTRSAQTGFVTGTTLGGVTTNHSFTPGPEVSASQANYGASTIYSASFTRDSLGRMTTRTETTQGLTSEFAFVYDSAGRLMTVTKNGLLSESFEYDPNGNRLQATTPNGTVNATVDVQDRLLTYGAATYTYTTNGELRRKTVGVDTTLYSYDPLGSLRSVRQPDGTLLEYPVDGEGRRVGKKVNGTLQKVWLWDGPFAIVAEFDGAGQLVSRFVYGDRVNAPEYIVRGGTTYRIITDERGSVRLVIDITTGSVAQRMDYDAFGQVLLDTQPGFQPFGFAGGIYDAQTRLVRFGRRDYDSESGRWTAKDPTGFYGGDSNLYGYVLNDPVNKVDPSGLEFDLSSLITNLAIRGQMLQARLWFHGVLLARVISNYFDPYLGKQPAFFDPIENAGIRSIFGVNIPGALLRLEELAAGRIPDLESFGLTRVHLYLYRLIAVRNLADLAEVGAKSGSELQTLRIKIIDQLLQMLPP